VNVSAISRRERYLLAAAGEEVDRPPVWIMRQAGRYDPQYLKLRERYSFRDLCFNAEACAAASILPLHTLGVDVLIIFNDILIPLEAMGLEVQFPDSGPVITNPLRGEADLTRFASATFDNPHVARNIRALQEAAGPEVPILGFAGCPFTLLSYAVEGRMSRNQHYIKELLYGNPALVHQMLERLTVTVTNYLVAQIEAGGAAGVQLFESQAPVLPLAEYAEFAAAYQQRVIAAVKSQCPETPITLYARGSAGILPQMVAAGADVVSTDWSHTLADARAAAGPGVTLQGNLDPTVLLVPDAVDARVEAMLDGFDWRRGYVANLGHGIIPQAKVEGAQKFVQAIQRLGGAA